MSTSSATMPSAMMQKPKRPLSAYNFFFQSERQKLLANNQRKGFAGLARTVAMKWKATTDTKTFEDLARKDKIRYLQEMAEWKKEEKARKKEQRKSNNKKSTKNNDDTKQQQAGTPSADAIVSSQEQEQQQQQMFARHVSVESSLDGEGGCNDNAMVAVPAYVPSSSLVNSLFQQQLQQQQQVFQNPSSLFPLDLFDTSNTAPLQQQQQQQFQQQQEQQELSDFLTPLSVDASDFMFADCSSSSSSCNDNKGQQHAIQQQQQQQQQQDSLCSLLTAAQNPLLEDEQEQQQQQQPLDYHQEESPLSSMLPLPLPTSWTTTTALSSPPTSGEMNLKFHNIDRLSQVLDADTVDLVIGMFGN